MQSGTTGINTVRIYNPIKQGYDQDPKGDFVRRWVPELAGLPGPRVHEPWRLRPIDLADSGCRLGETYPLPLVDHESAARRARERVWAVRRSAGYRELADAIQRRHGSRRSGLPPTTRGPRRGSAEAGSRQLDLGL
jgi:deoxyribodipyrimidine photo-lyase